MSALDLFRHHEPDQIVAFGERGEKSVAQLLEDAARISANLPEPFPGSHVLLVLEEDRFALAAACIATLHRGHAIALPSSSRRDSILAIADRPDTAATLHDTDAGKQSRLADLLEKDTPVPPIPTPFLPQPDRVATVFTSGTTGKTKAWPKDRGALLGEAHLLGRVFDVRPGDRIVGTVSAGHIYGLLFTILLPLARGAAFCRDTPLHAEAIARSIRKHDANLLVTVPIGIRSLSSLPAGSLPSLRRVFCSTGPLPQAIADDFVTRHGRAITEILGSTETGGIARRERIAEPSRAELLWTPLEGVEVSAGADGRLHVDSPHLHGALPRPFETDDLVRLEADGTFEHLGRADEVVKVAGRRVSIRELEEAILRIPEVEEAAVVAVPDAGARGHQIVAAVTPSSCSVGAIREALLERFEPSCLPRRFACIDALPKENNGKVPRDRLLRLFDLGDDGRAIRWDLDWSEPTRAVDQELERFEAHVSLPENYAWFDGHFERYPVLAGAVQLKELILPMIARAFPDLGRIESMNRIKFSNPIKPLAKLRIRIERRPQARRVSFEIAGADGEICSRGHLTHVAGAVGSASD